MAAPIRQGLTSDQSPTKTFAEREDLLDAVAAFWSETQPHDVTALVALEN